MVKGLLIFLIILTFLGLNPVAGDSRDDAINFKWKNGDYISPLPANLYQRGFDCDDATLFSYYFIRAARPDYHIDIKYEYDMYSEWYNHVWLSVTGDNVTYIYDAGKPIKPILYAKGKNITLYLLTHWVNMDAPFR